VHLPVLTVAVRSESSLVPIAGGNGILIGMSESRYPLDYHHTMAHTPNNTVSQHAYSVRTCIDSCRQKRVELGTYHWG